MAAAPLKGRMAHATHTLVIILFFNDARELLLNVNLYEVDDHINANLLVHYGQAPIVLVASCNQSREENLLEALVVEVSYRQGAQLLNNGTFTLTKQRLILFVIQTEVAYQENGLMEELLRVFLSISSLTCIE